MKRLYTGPFSAVYRNVWIERARHMQTDEWLWLLPTRHLLHTVRQQLMEGQAGLVDVPLLTFDDVARTLIQHVDRPTQSLNPYAREKLIESLLERYADDDRLSIFRPIMDQPGLYRSVAHAIGEMKRSGLTVADADNYLHRSGTEHLAEQRQTALAFLFLRYQEALHGGEHNVLVDPEECLILACDALERDAIPAGNPFTMINTLWVDHFTDFTPLQLRLLQALIKKSAQSGIYIPFPYEKSHELPQLTAQLDETRLSLELLGFDHVELAGLTAGAAHKQLQDDWLPNGAPLSRDTEQEADALLQWRADDGDGSDDDRITAPTGLECLPACTQKREVETIAKEIKRLVCFEGVVLNEIALVVKDSSYEPLIQEVMQRDGIPLHAHERIGLHETAVARQLLALLSLAGSNWERRDVLCLAQGGYIHWQHIPPHGIETWVKKAGIDKGKKSWHESCIREFKRLELNEHELTEIVMEQTERERQVEQLNRQKQQLQRTLEWLQEVEKIEYALTSATAWTERIDHIERVWRELHVERCIKRLWSDALKQGDVKGYCRDLEAYRCLCDTLQEMKRLELSMPEKTRRSWQGFVREFRDVIKQKHVIVTRGQSGGVRLFDPSAIRGSGFEAVFVLGLNEGHFPAHHSEDWLIRDAERVAFYGGQARLSASYAHNEMEQLFFEMAINSARRHLILSYISPRANEHVLRSRFIEQLEQQYEPGSWHAPERFAEAMESRLFARRVVEVTSPQEYRNRFMAHWGVNGDNAAQLPSLTHDPLYRANEQRITDLIRHAAIEKERRESFYGRWDGHLLGPRIHDRLQQDFSQDRTYSVSWINDYAVCPLHFFFARVLRVQPLEEMELTLSPLDTGNVLHEVLRRLLANDTDRHMCDRDLDTWQTDLKAVFAEVAAEWENERLHLLTPLWSLEKDRLLRIMERWLQHEYVRQGRRRFKPQHLEFSFGLPRGERMDEDSTEQPITLPLANEILRLVGRIDRIDHDEDGNFVLYDYKLSTQRYNNCHKMERTTNFQLPLYVLAYRQWLREQGRAGEPIGVGFYGLRSQDKFKKIGLWEKNSLEDLGLGRTRAGVTEDVAGAAEVALPRIADMLHGIRTGRFYMLPEHEPNVYYGDQSIFRNDLLTLQRKIKQATVERRDDHA